MVGTSYTPRTKRLNVLVLARSFPSTLFPNAGLWTLRPMAALSERCDIRVVSPVPYCPPIPGLGPLRYYTRFRTIPTAATVGGLQVHYPRFAIGPGNSLYALETEAYYWGVRRLVDRLWAEQPFDLIHANFIYPDGAVAHRLAERHGVPFVVTELAPWTGWLDRRGVARNALPAARAAASILALSTHVKETIHSHEPSANVHVVPPGVEGDEFPLRPAGRRKREQILFVGMLNFNKGVDVLLRAVAVLRDRGAPGRLVLVGGSHYRNTERQEEQLRALAADLGLGDRATFAGKQAPPDVARLMGESSVVVLPSRAEAFGSVLAEAISCGTPVVASRSGGPEDIVSEDVGVLVPVGDHVALADGISSVLGAPERYPPEELRASALSRFGIATVADRIREAYEEALESSTPESSASAPPGDEASPREAA